MSQIQLFGEMSDSKSHKNRLIEKLDALVKKRDDFSAEINELRIEIDKLGARETEGKAVMAENRPESNRELARNTTSSVPEHGEDGQETRFQTEEEEVPPPIPTLPGDKSNFEEFVGENLLGKFGIAIVVFGVALGVKFALNNPDISPTWRMLLGYFSGLCFLGAAMVLRKRYETFSAGLMSGSLAIMYFTTFAAYEYYGLFPPFVAYVVMIGLTVFTVWAAIDYNREIIAHFGLVGAYAIPFLLGDGAGRIGFLFIYVAIVNIGILTVSFKKFWKPLIYSAFGLTWLVFCRWLVFDYRVDEHFALALSFLTLYFGVFQMTLLSYKALRGETFDKAGIGMLLTNALLFFGIGYALLNNCPPGQPFMGAFVACNGLVHLVAGVIVYRHKRGNRNLSYLLMGMATVFVNIAVAVQWDGSWIALLWAWESAFLFWLGRTRRWPFSERLACALMFLALIGLVHEWAFANGAYIPQSMELRIAPIFNRHFLTSVMFVAAFGFIVMADHGGRKNYMAVSGTAWSKIVSFAAPSILVFAVFFTFYLEIANFWNRLYLESTMTANSQLPGYPRGILNSDLLKFKTLWLINYALFFFAMLSFLNIKRIRNRNLGLANLGLNAVSIAAFLTVGLYVLRELRKSYLAQTASEFLQISGANIWIRYVSFAFVAMVILASLRYIRQGFMGVKFEPAFDVLLHCTLLGVLSSELILWMDLNRSSQTYAITLSVVWGVYALFLVVLGLWKKKKHLRIGGIVLIGITLQKLWFFDLTRFDAVAKTIVFVSLGLLLLVISFLYGKFKHILHRPPLD